MHSTATGGALTFTLYPVLERPMGVKFIWGEMKQLNGEQKCPGTKPIFSSARDRIDFDYCIIRPGCNLGPFEPMRFPTGHEAARKISDWPPDPEECHKLHDLNKTKVSVLAIGAEPFVWRLVPPVLAACPLPRRARERAQELWWFQRERQQALQRQLRQVVEQLEEQGQALRWLKRQQRQKAEWRRSSGRPSGGGWRSRTPRRHVPR